MIQQHIVLQTYICYKLTLRLRCLLHCYSALRQIHSSYCLITRKGLFYKNISYYWLPRYPIKLNCNVPCISNSLFLGTVDSNSIAASLYEGLLCLCECSICWFDNMLSYVDSQNLPKNFLSSLIFTNPHILSWRIGGFLLHMQIWNNPSWKTIILLIKRQSINAVAIKISFLFLKIPLNLVSILGQDFSIKLSHQA